MATGSVCIAVVKGSYFWTPEKGRRIEFGLVWSSSASVSSATSLCDKPARSSRLPQLLSQSPGSRRAQPEPFPWMAEVLQGCLTIWGFCSWLKTTWTGIAFCPSEAQLVFCFYIRTKGWTLFCSTELTMWPQLIQNSWKFQRNFKQKKTEYC